MLTAEAPICMPLRCTCCGTEVLAERVGDQLVISGKRHGREHVLVINLDKDQQNGYPASEFGGARAPA